jgi:hypothetical protein
MTGPAAARRTTRVSRWSVSGCGCAGRRACAVPLGKPAQHPVVRGFPGVRFETVTDDEHGFYRGLYEWNGPARAGHCARCLWRVLALVSVPGPIGYRVVPGIRPADALSDASATVPEQVTMWLPMVPRSQCAARRQQTWPHQGSGRVGIMLVICQVGDFRGDWPSTAQRWPMRASGSRAAMCCVLTGWPPCLVGELRGKISDCLALDVTWPHRTTAWPGASGESSGCTTSR